MTLQERNVMLVAGRNGEYTMEQFKDTTNETSSVYASLTGPVEYHLTNDYMFRAVMQKNENVLKHLLCALLRLSPESVEKLEIMNPIILGAEIDSKTCILDIRLILNNNHYYNIEMQVSKQKYWKERSLTYLCRNYDNLESGQEYAEVIPAMQISILDFDLFENIEELSSRYYLINENPEYRNQYTDGFGIITLNLPQIHNKKVIATEQNTELYQWARFFKAESWEEMRMLAQNNEAMNECVNTMAQLSEDEQIRMQCEARKDNLAIEKGLYNRGYRQGQQEGQHLGELRGKVLTYAEFGLNLEEISEKVSIPVDEVKQILSTK